MSRGVQIQCCSLLHLGDRARKDSVERGWPFAPFGQGRWRSSGGAVHSSAHREVARRRASAGRTQSSVRSRAVLWVWAALLLYRGIRAKEVPHRFERGGHLSDEGAGEPSTSTQVDRNLGIRLGQGLKSAAEQGCRLPETQRTYHERNGAIADGSVTRLAGSRVARDAVLLDAIELLRTRARSRSPRAGKARRRSGSTGRKPATGCASRRGLPTGAALGKPTSTATSRTGVASGPFLRATRCWMRKCSQAGASGPACDGPHPIAKELVALRAG